MNNSEEFSSVQACISACLTCHSICQRTLEHCLKLGGDHASRPHITLLLDCVEICQTSANFMLRGSALHGLTCRVCSEICDACAGHCEDMAGTDVAMQACARTCRECAETCREMADSMGIASLGENDEPEPGTAGL